MKKEWNWKWTVLWIIDLTILFLLFYDYGKPMINLFIFLTGGDRY